VVGIVGDARVVAHVDHVAINCVPEVAVALEFGGGAAECGC
jgi:hypothetical protein